MFRYLFKISYDGSSFFGWQKQVEQITVQQTIEENLSKIHSLRETNIIGCGRTDTGVHAKEYYFHWDSEEFINKETIQYKLNKMLPNSIAVLSIQEVNIDFHARFSAVKRTYRYFINGDKNPFVSAQSWQISQQLNIDNMNASAQLLIGEKDFSSFAKIHTDVKNHICNVSYAKWKAKGKEISFEISANRFLRNMVRAIVGTCVDVGLNKMSIQEFKEIIDSKDRQKGSGSAPAQGLFLWTVDYKIS